MASATAAAAAANVMIKIAKTCALTGIKPVQREKATKFTLAAFSIISTEIKMPTTCRLESAPNKPMQKRVDEKNKI